jgi:hypothetical protein
MREVARPRARAQVFEFDEAGEFGYGDYSGYFFHSLPSYHPAHETGPLKKP